MLDFNNRNRFFALAHPTASYTLRLLLPLALSSLLFLQPLRAAPDNSSDLNSPPPNDGCTITHTCPDNTTITCSAYGTASSCQVFNLAVKCSYYDSNELIEEFVRCPRP